jgi:hypothetical protein
MPLFRFLSGDVFELPVSTCGDTKRSLFDLLEDKPAHPSLIQLFRKGVLVDHTTMLDEEVVYDVFITQQYLRSWVKLNEKLLDMRQISQLPESIPYLSQNPDRIEWEYLCGNPSDTAIEWLKEKKKVVKRINILLWSNTHPQAIQWIKEYIDKTGQYPSTVCFNPGALTIIKTYPLESLFHNGYIGSNKNPDVIQYIRELIALPDFDRSLLGNDFWYRLSSNPIAMDILLDNQEHINWYSLSCNSSAIPLLTENFQRLLTRDIDHIVMLARNPNPLAFPLLMEHMDEIKQNYREMGQERIQRNIVTGLSANPNPDALEYVEKNIRYLNEWGSLCANPNAIEIVERQRFWYNPKIDLVNYHYLSKNPAIFLT